MPLRFWKPGIPGEEGGAAIAETLAGDNDPAGRLPVTFYESLDQLPPFEDYSMAGRTYRYFAGQPLYGFGYGLSYTTFAYSHLKLSPAKLKAGDPLTVEADVTNTGKRPGDEVVELYLRGPQAGGAPLRSLRSFDRVTLQPGETRHVLFTLDPAQSKRGGSGRGYGPCRRAATLSSWAEGSPARAPESKASSPSAAGRSITP